MAQTNFEGNNYDRKGWSSRFDDNRQARGGKTQQGPGPYRDFNRYPRQFQVQHSSSVGSLVKALWDKIFQLIAIAIKIIKTLPEAIVNYIIEKNKEGKKTKKNEWTDQGAYNKERQQNNYQGKKRSDYKKGPIFKRINDNMGERQAYTQILKAGTIWDIKKIANVKEYSFVASELLPVLTAIKAEIVSTEHISEETQQQTKIKKIMYESEGGWEEEKIKNLNVSKGKAVIYYTQGTRTIYKSMISAYMKVDKTETEQGCIFVKILMTGSLDWQFIRLDEVDGSGNHEIYNVSMFVRCIDEKDVHCTWVFAKNTLKVNDKIKTIKEIGESIYYHWDHELEEITENETKKEQNKDEDEIITKGKEVQKIEEEEKTIEIEQNDNKTE